MKIRVALLALSVLAIGPLALTLAGAQEDDSAEKSAFVRFVEEKISTPDRKIDLGAIDGALSSDVRLASITVSDREGAWLRIEGVHLVWSRLALLRGTLDVDSLEAEKIEVVRKPLPAETVDPAASDGFALPDLPVSVKLGRLAAPSVVLGALVLGEEARLAVTASASLANGSLDANLAVSRTDSKPGELSLKAAYAAEAKTLDLDLEANEPADGVMASLLNLPGKPSVGLKLKGAGPLDDFAADLTLATDGVNRIAGRTTIARDGDGYRFGSALAGDLAALAQPDYALYLAGRSTLDLSGRVDDAGPITIDKLALAAPVLSLQGSATLAADHFPTAIDIDGRLAGKDGALPLGGAGATTRLGEGRLRFSFGHDGAWSLELAAEGLSTPSFGAGSLAINGRGAATDLADAQKRRIDFTLSGGSSGLSFTDAAVGAAVGGELSFSGSGRWADGAPLTIDALRLATPTAEASFAGKVEEGRIEGQQMLLAPSLAPFSALAGRSLDGGVELAASGILVPTTGAFDLTLDGKADALSAGIDQLDSLLSGATKLTGRIARDTSGLKLQNVRIANPALTLTADGNHALESTDVTATLTLPDVGRVEPKAKGAAGLMLSVRGSDGPLDLTARLSSDRLTLAGNALENLGVDLVGKLDGATFDGKLNGTGRLKGKPLSLTAGLSHTEDGNDLRDLTLAVADSRITGNVALTEAGLMTGQLAVRSPDLSALGPLVLTDLAGRLDAEITLAPRDGRQTAKASLKAAELAVAGNRIASADAEATIIDLLGAPKIDGRFAARGFSSPAASVANIDGTAKSDGRATSFAIKAGGINAPQLAETGLGNLAATASGRLDGNRVTLASAKLTGPTGFGAEATGVIPLSGGGLAVDVRANLPLSLAQSFVATRGTRLTGTANAAMKATGSLASPDLSGRVTVSGASIADPLTTMRLEAIEVALQLSGNSVRIEKATGSVKGGGRLSAEGSLGLSGGLPVDVRITATKARITDGRIVTADLSSSLSVGGSVVNGLMVAGKVDIARAEITVPEGGGGAAALIEVRHKNTPADVNATLKRISQAAGGNRTSSEGGLSVGLDVAVNAPRQLFVRGRGIDAELGGNLTVRGTLDNVQPVGKFTLIRGRVQVIGQRINLTEGTVTLQGDLNPYLSLSATTTSDSISVTATVEGYADNPSIVLSSSPELPQDEILARFLFKRSVSDLSALQIAQLAEAVTQLAGGGDGNGIVDRLRASVGLDDLDVNTDAQGNAAVTAGRYITERVYLGVTAGEGGRSGMSVNLDITDDVKARAEATQEQSKVGVYFEKEY
ncbi:translocation/assembly module TamB domain-containing protein [Pleomorphomonas sp. JP5]|uniref:translocation/assembly module TamB domain-containing protein n=1 Tax=Pleomorphomonas sp. JP5 TaxID=2942998 RepID=UPI0020449E03|nr:translocation/assembly module TamB domain-containing protein [Pleomorphomonas sp. JP5]MCM5557878.1 translocation/assembly module TamB domain-containing protein [Pleomorphomonas sp. JP5]